MLRQILIIQDSVALLFHDAVHLVAVVRVGAQMRIYTLLLSLRRKGPNQHRIHYGLQIRRSNGRGMQGNEEFARKNLSLEGDEGMKGKGRTEG
jgi:hypothetical protein